MRYKRNVKRVNVPGGGKSSPGAAAVFFQAAVSQIGAAVIGILLVLALTGCGTSETTGEAAEASSEAGREAGEGMDCDESREQSDSEDGESAGQDAAEDKGESRRTADAGTEISDKAKALSDGAKALSDEAKVSSAGMEVLKKPEVKTPPEGWELVLRSEDWGLAFREPGAQPVGNASVQDLAWYNAYYMGAEDEKVIYLTFDCGYENGNTEPILDALKKHDVKATFFVVGHFLETAPEIARRMVEEGHAVGNHTYHHLDMPTISDREVFQKELEDVADLFAETTGAELSPYYRPPQGKCNVENLKMAQELGYYTIFWSVAYVDWNVDDQPSHEEAFEKLNGRLHPGAVVLLHNVSRTNGEILDELLTRWEEMGYSFRPLSELCAG